MAAFALRQARQHGIHLPYHQMETVEEGDLPWLDPFSMHHGISSPSLSLSNQELQESGLIGQSQNLISEELLSEQSAIETVGHGQMCVLSEETRHSSTVKLEDSSPSNKQDPQTTMHSNVAILNQTSGICTSEQNHLSPSVSVESWATPNTSPSNSVASIRTHNLLGMSQGDQNQTSIHPTTLSKLIEYGLVSMKADRDVTNSVHLIQPSKDVLTAPLREAFRSPAVGDSDQPPSTGVFHAENHQIEMTIEATLKRSVSSTDFPSRQSLNYCSQEHVSIVMDCDECVNGNQSNTSIISSSSEVSCISIGYYTAYETLEVSRV